MNRRAIFFRPPGWEKVRWSSFQIALHILHPVLLQEHLDLFLERHLPMVLGLALNVFRRVLDAGDADAESAVAFLPLEVPKLPLSSWMDFATESVEGIERSTCTWSSTPPMTSAFILFARATPPR